MVSVGIPGAGSGPGPSRRSAVLGLVDGLEPLVPGPLAGDGYGQVGEPAVRGGPVPVLDAGGDLHDVAGMELPDLASPLLVAPLAGDADEDLPSAGRRRVDVPVVATSRLERDVGHRQGHPRQRCQVAPPDEVLGIGIVGLAYGEGHRSLVGRPRIPLFRVVRPDLLGQVERRPGLRPSGIERRVRQDLRDLPAGYPVCPGRPQVVPERAVRDPLGHQGHYRHERAVAQRQPIGPGPYVPEEDVVVELGELRREIPQRIPSSGLLDSHVDLLRPCGRAGDDLPLFNYTM